MAASKKKTVKAKSTAKGGAISIRPDLSGYTIGKSKTASGRKTVDTGDKVANELRSKTLEQVYAAVSKQTGEAAKALHLRYGHLNPGMQRMILGNRLRGQGARKSAKKAA